MSVVSIGVGVLFLISVVLIWFLIYYFGNPVIEDPDGVARIEGSCGDTMEIGLKISDNQVIDTHYWTNGCSYSKNCVQTAAALARNKSINEVRKINMISIMDITGTVPNTHLHCAQLAETTLQKSLDNYIAAKLKTASS